MKWKSIVFLDRCSKKMPPTIFDIITTLALEEVSDFCTG
jgi:hypothetical protein